MRLFDDEAIYYFYSFAYDNVIEEKQFKIILRKKKLLQVKIFEKTDIHHFNLLIVGWKKIQLSKKRMPSNFFRLLNDFFCHPFNNS